MTCSPIKNQKNETVGFVCSTPSYYTFIGKKRIDFTYSPWYGIDVLGANGKFRKGTKKEIDAICDWLKRNTYQRAYRGDRELIGYVKKKWKP